MSWRNYIETTLRIGGQITGITPEICAHINVLSGSWTVSTLMYSGTKQFAVQIVLVLAIKPCPNSKHYESQKQFSAVCENL